MGVIQGAINSMLGTTSGFIMATKAMKKLDVGKSPKVVNQQPIKRQNKINKVSMHQANNHALQAIEQKKTQRRNFMDYLGKQESSLGKVGDLPKQIQKQIAKQFTQSQRRTLMNRMDREKKNGGNI